jgi:prepilin-type N-terminal cleavage/methylation domain-containing protein
MVSTLSARRGGFTLVEIMIVVAIIALLAAIAVPNFVRARKRAQATNMLEELRTIDGAISQYAIEFNLSSGDDVSWNAVHLYCKPDSRLYFCTGLDPFGWSYRTYSGGTTFKVDELPVMASETYGLLSDAVPKEFWSPYTNF